MALSTSLANRLGFTILGLTNNFAYVIMLSAAYDLLASINHTTDGDHAANNQPISNQTQPYCNEHSTSTILLADTLPSLATKLFYPFLLVGIPTSYKVFGTAFLSAISFIITGSTKLELLIFTGVVCASFSSGLGESTFLSNTPLYGDVSLTGWSIGTGAAGLLGSISYALLTMVLPIKVIMLIMLVVPAAMIFSFFCVIRQVHDHSQSTTSIATNITGPNSIVLTTSRNSDGQQLEDTQQQPISKQNKNYGAESSQQDIPLVAPPLDSFSAKVAYLPNLSKYFLPLLLVYFGEYFINQGLFEIIYFPEVQFLNHKAQYRWFQVSYQLGVFISRSSLDLMKIRNLWAMSLLQLLNALIFLAHTSKVIHIPSFYIVIVLIIYEGLLGGFTYVNTFYRVKKEVQEDRQEFCISAVTSADSLGIVIAALTALPVHDALCKLYM